MKLMLITQNPVMLRAVVLCVLAVCAFAAAPAKLPDLHHHIAAAVTSGKVPTVAYTPGLAAAYVQITTYLEASCATVISTRFAMDGGCSTSGLPTQTTLTGSPASTNVSWDGTTLTGCGSWDSYSCGGTIAACVPLATSSCAAGFGFFAKVSTASGTFVSSTSYNSTTCSGLPAGPSYVPVGTCLAFYQTSVKVTAGYTQCNYTDTTCTAQDYCVTCQSGACCTDPSFDGTSVRVGAASAVAPSLMVLAAAVLAVLAF
jgi:hypothetical protein